MQVPPVWKSEVEMSSCARCYSAVWAPHILQTLCRDTCGSEWPLPYLQRSYKLVL